MPRPHKLHEPTRTLNVILTKEQYEWLRQFAADRTRFLGREYSMSEKIRELVWFVMRKDGGK